MNKSNMTKELSSMIVEQFNSNQKYSTAGNEKARLRFIEKNINKPLLKARQIK